MPRPLRPTDEEIRTRWFGKHLAERHIFQHPVLPGVQVEWLRWSQPSNSNRHVIYMAVQNTLLIYGDLGEAVYRWSQDISLEWCARLEFSYFTGKCCASDKGRDCRDWDHEVAHDNLVDFVKRNFDRPKQIKVMGKFSGSGGGSCMNREEEWMMWLSASGSSVFGEAYTELSEIGKVPSCMARSYLIGLDMAMTQIAAKSVGAPS